MPPNWSCRCNYKTIRCLELCTLSQFHCSTFVKPSVSNPVNFNVEVPTNLNSIDVISDPEVDKQGTTKPSIHLKKYINIILWLALKELLKPTVVTLIFPVLHNVKAQKANFKDYVDERVDGAAKVRQELHEKLQALPKRFTVFFICLVRKQVVDLATTAYVEKVFFKTTKTNEKTSNFSEKDPFASKTLKFSSSISSLCGFLFLKLHNFVR